MTIILQTPSLMGFSRQEYWGGLPFPSPGGLPDAGIEPGSPTLQTDPLSSKPPGSPTRKESVGLDKQWGKFLRKYGCKEETGW